MQQQAQLLQLCHSKENSELQEIKKRFSNYSKYFFNIRKNITLIYDKTIVYVINKQYLKLIDLGKLYLITDLVYHYDRNILLFLTSEGHLYAHFAASKTQLQIKKDFKKVCIMEWIYNTPQIAHLFIAEEGGIHIYKLEQEKKGLKQIKHISKRYHCFLYEPITQFLVGFEYGECDIASTFHFDVQKARNWFKAGEIEVNFKDDEVIAERIRKTKSFYLEGSRVGKQIFRKPNNQDYFIDILNINSNPYMFFYFPNQGKLQLTPMMEHSQRKQLTIKLPSDSLPSFNIVDNMLVVHLKSERITFIYDVNNSNFQTLVSPYTLAHEQSEYSAKCYSCEFVGKRALSPDGLIFKWKLRMPVIYHYLKNQILVFEFLNRRSNSKMELVKWIRQNLFSFKLINLSKMWKAIFAKVQSGLYDENQILSIVEIYSNLFYTLSIEPLISKEALANVLIECLRQAHQFRIRIPDQFQFLAAQLLLQTERHELLTYLCHHDIIRTDKRIIKIVFEKGCQAKDQLLVTLAIDLAHQGSSPKQVLRLILKSQRVKEGKRYIKCCYQKMEALDMLEMAQYIRQREKKLDFVRFVRSFVAYKYPSMNQIYLDEAEKKILI